MPPVALVEILIALYTFAAASYAKEPDAVPPSAKITLCSVHVIGEAFALKGASTIETAATAKAPRHLLIINPTLPML